MAFCFSGRPCCSSLFLNETFSVCHVSFCCSVWQQVYYDASPATTVIFWCNDSCTDHTASAEKDQHRAFLGTCHNRWEWGGSMSRHARSLSLALKMTVQLLAIVFNGLSTTQTCRPLQQRKKQCIQKRNQTDLPWLY